MGTLLTQVDHWRDKADELRAIADTLRNAVARDHLLEMADAYDSLADRMETVELTRQFSKVGPAFDRS